MGKSNHIVSIPDDGTKDSIVIIRIQTTEGMNLLFIGNIKLNLPTFVHTPEQSSNR